MDIDNDVIQLLEKYTFCSVIAALARYAHAPKHQEVSTKEFAKSFRDLNKLYNYLINH